MHLDLKLFLTSQGTWHAITSIRPDQAVYLKRSDDQLLEVIENFNGGSIKSEVHVSMHQLVQILEKCSRDTVQSKREQRSS